MHERLVHEIIMVLFALSTILVFIETVRTAEILFAVLLVALLILLVPYIMHYYVLEIACNICMNNMMKWNAGEPAPIKETVLSAFAFGAVVCFGCR